MGPRFHFSSAIFGQDYLERFLAAGLPSQLSPGNLPALAGDQPRPCYHIHAPAAEALAIRASALYPRLQALVEVEFHDIQAQVERFRARACFAYDVMNAAYADTSARALAEGAALIAIWPDVIFSDGTFRRLKELAARGIRGVGVVGNQAGPGIVAAARARHLDPASGALCLSPRQVVALTLEHLTPYWLQFCADHPCFPSEDATHIQWRVGDEGILTRSSFFHPLLAMPTERSAACNLQGLANGIDTTDFLATLCTDFDREIHLVTDSDEFCFVGIDSRMAAFRESPRPFNRAEMALAMARTAHAHTRALFSQSLRFHTGEPSAAWVAGEAEAQGLADDILGLVDLMRLRPGLHADLLSLQARSAPTPQNEALCRAVSDRITLQAREWTLSGKRVAIHGASAWARKLLEDTPLGRCAIAGIVDSNPALWGKPFLQWSIRSPAELPALAAEVILVASFRAQEDMVAQLKGLALGGEIHRLLPAPEPPAERPR